MGHGCVSVEVSSGRLLGAARTEPSSSPSRLSLHRHSRHSRHTVQPAAPAPGTGGTLGPITTPKCPRCSGKTVPDPPHSTRNAPMGHGWVSAGVSFWSAPPHDPEGAVSPADPARISRHSGHSAQPAVPPREAGALCPRKNHGKVPPPPQQDPRDPPHSHGNAPMGHRCLSFRATSDLRSRRPLPDRSYRAPHACKPGI